MTGHGCAGLVSQIEGLALGWPAGTGLGWVDPASRLVGIVVGQVNIAPGERVWDSDGRVQLPEGLVLHSDAWA